MSPAEEAWDEYVHRTNPHLDRHGVREAFLAGYAAGGGAPGVLAGQVIEAADLLSSARSGINDPGLAMAWGRRRVAILNAAIALGWRS